MNLPSVSVSIALKDAHNLPDTCIKNVMQTWWVAESTEASAPGKELIHKSLRYV